MSEIKLKGKVIGFEEYGDYVMESVFGDRSPFRVLSCLGAPISFVVVNPFTIVDDYSLQIDDETMKFLGLNGGTIEDVAILCIIRSDNQNFFVNLRSPLVINTARGIFVQTILQDEKYGVSVPFTVKSEK